MLGFAGGAISVVEAESDIVRLGDSDSLRRGELNSRVLRSSSPSSAENSDSSGVEKRSGDRGGSFFATVFFAGGVGVVGVVGVEYFVDRLKEGVLGYKWKLEVGYTHLSLETRGGGEVELISSEGRFGKARPYIPWKFHLYSSLPVC
jgi:hypothetical protein